MQFSTVVFVEVPNWKESVVGLCGTPSVHMESRDGGWGIHETTIHGEVFVVGDDDWYISSFENQSTKDLCEEV